MKGWRSERLRHYLEMTTAISSDQFEQRLDHLVEAAKALHKQWRIPFSIECAGPNNGDNVYIVFTNNTWSTGYDKTISKICDDFHLGYHIIPLEGKLAITLSQ